MAFITPEAPLTHQKNLLVVRSTVITQQKHLSYNRSTSLTSYLTSISTGIMARGSNCLGIKFLSFSDLDEIADTGRCTLAPGVKRTAVRILLRHRVNGEIVRSIVIDPDGNDELVQEKIAEDGHVFLIAFIARMQKDNTDYSYAECLDSFSQLLAYNPVTPLKPTTTLITSGRGMQARMHVLGVQKAIQAIQNVFKQDYIGQLFMEDIQAAINALHYQNGTWINKNLPPGKSRR
jgi:hypothetical protein